MSTDPDADLHTAFEDLFAGLVADGVTPADVERFAQEVADGLGAIDAHSGSTA